MPKKILIIDDDPAIVKYLKAIFSDNGYATCSASSSMEGLEVVKVEKPDLICLDLQMPGEWGPRFYRKLRKDKEVRDTPIIVVSGIDGDHYDRNVSHFFVFSQLAIKSRAPFTRHLEVKADQIRHFRFDHFQPFHTAGCTAGGIAIVAKDSLEIFDDGRIIINDQYLFRHGLSSLSSMIK